MDILPFHLAVCDITRAATLRYFGSEWHKQIQLAQQSAHTCQKCRNIHGIVQQKSLDRDLLPTGIDTQCLSGICITLSKRSCPCKTAYCALTYHITPLLLSAFRHQDYLSYQHHLSCRTVQKHCASMGQYSNSCTLYKLEEVLTQYSTQVLTQQSLVQ